MVREKRKMEMGNVLMIIALVTIFMGTALMQVKAAQGNTSYHFVFDYVGDTDRTESRAKWSSYDSSYINCTSAEIDGSFFYAWFYYWNDYDGTQYSNSVSIFDGSERWVANDAMSGDTTWFLGELGYGDDGAIFDGRWRPDSSL